MSRLLVSVRSVDEAVLAATAGADIIDVKEPANGPLGRADLSVWKAIRAAVPRHIPVSAALGEMKEYAEASLPPALEGLNYWKLGLAGSGSAWRDDWRALRRRWRTEPCWVAVAYADWERAGSPDPADVLEEAMRIDECVGILVDTWDKSRPSPVDLSWSSWFSRGRDAGLITALAGRLDRDSVKTLRPLRPDLIAVRGAACLGGDRNGSIDPARVRELGLLARSLETDS